MDSEDLNERAGEPQAVTNTLTKARMAERLFDELGLNKREAKEIVELFFRGSSRVVGEQRAREALRVRQLRPARQARAARAKSKDGRRDSHHGSSRRHIPAGSETEGAG